MYIAKSAVSTVSRPAAMFGDFNKIMKWNLVNVILILNILSASEYLYLSPEVSIKKFIREAMIIWSVISFSKESVYYFL